MFFHSTSVPHGKKSTPPALSSKCTKKRKSSSHNRKRHKTMHCIEDDRRMSRNSQYNRLRLKILSVIEELDAGEHEVIEQCDALHDALLQEVRTRTGTQTTEDLQLEHFTGEELYLLAALSTSNLVQRFSYLSMGASERHNHQQCLFECALALITGRGTAPCIKDAKRMLKHCIALYNCPKSLLELGNVYCDEGKFIKAREFYVQSALQDNATALNNLGDLYMNGLGVEEDRHVAEALFNLAVERGHAFGLVNLGFLRESESKIREAMAFYERAGRAGCSAGYFNLGVLFTKGNDMVERDLRVARHYFTLAHEIDHEDVAALEVLRDFDLQVRNESCMGAL